MAVQLTEGWWKTAWPSDTPPKSYDAMKQAIKKAKKTKRGLSIVEHKAALNHILSVLIPLRNEAKTQFKTAPTSKIKANKMLTEFEKFILAELSAIKPDAKPIVVFKKPFGHHVRDKIKTASRVKDEMPRVDIKLELMTWAVNELRDKNAEAMLNTQINKVFDQMVGATSKKVDNLLKPVDGMPNAKLRATISAQVQSDADEVSDIIKKVPAEVLRKIGLNARLAKKYKIDKAVSIGTGAVGTGLAVAGFAVPGTPAVAAAAAIRSSVALSKEIIKLMSSIEDKATDLRSDLSRLKNAFADASGKAKKMSKEEAGFELTISVANSLIGTDLIANVSTAKGKLKELERHIALTSMKAQKLQGEVVKALDRGAVFKKKLAAAIGTKKMSSAFDALQKSEKELDKVLEKTFKLVVRVNKAEDDFTQLRRSFKTLAIPGTKLKIAQQAVDICISFGADIGGIADAVKHVSGAGVLMGIAGVYIDSEEKARELA